MLQQSLVVQDQSLIEFHVLLLGMDHVFCDSLVDIIKCFVFALGLVEDNLYGIHTFSEFPDIDLLSQQQLPVIRLLLDARVQQTLHGLACLDIEGKEVYLRVYRLGQSNLLVLWLGVSDSSPG